MSFGSGVGAILAKVGQCLTGSILTLDCIPYYLLPFPVKPEVIDDEWGSEFAHATSPGSRYQYPIFKGNTPRTVTFKLRFDADVAGLSTGFGGGSTACESSFTGGADDINSFGGGFLYTAEMHAIIAILETLKLPKQGFATTIADGAGAFVKVQQGVSDPAPPLCLLAINPLKLMVGYFSEIKITPTKRTKWMFVTRIEVDCKFLVTPDYIFTNLEDAERILRALSSYYFIGARMVKGRF